MHAATRHMRPRGGYRSSGRLTRYASQVIVLHVASAALAEMVFSHEGFAFPAVYGFVEFATFAALPVLTSVVFRLSRRTVPHRFHESTLVGVNVVPHGASCCRQTVSSETAGFVLCGFTMMVSHGLGLMAYMHVNYTTAMLFGAAKLPLVLLMGRLLNRGDAVPSSAHFAALCVAVGLAVFGAAERRGAPRFDAIGLVLVALNLALGAVTFNLQQRLLHRASGVSGSLPTSVLAPRGMDGGVEARAQKLGAAAAERLMVVQYATGACFFAASAAVSGELVAFRSWCSGTVKGGPLHQLAPVFAGATLTALGIRALLMVTAEFDAPRASIITTLRKVCTFLLSCALFPKAYTACHFIGAVLTMAGSIGVHHSLNHAKQHSRVQRSLDHDKEWPDT